MGWNFLECKPVFQIDYVRDKRKAVATGYCFQRSLVATVAGTVLAQIHIVAHLSEPSLMYFQGFIPLRVMHTTVQGSSQVNVRSKNEFFD